MGLRQLVWPMTHGETVAERCDQLTVFDLSSVHQVVVRHCVCNPEKPFHRRRQLFRRGWFPAMLVRPHTIFTFKLLDFFHELQSHNKTNLFDFYNTIVHLSNNTGLSPKIVSVVERLLFFPLFLTPNPSSVTMRSPLYITRGFTSTF